MILIVDLCYKKDSLSNLEFVKPIERIVNKTHEVQIRYYKDISNDDLQNADKVILCGTALKNNEGLKNLSYFEWLKTFNKPVLGICAGMQTIAHLFGSNLIKQKEIGFKKIKKLTDNILFDDDLEVYALHTFSAINNEEFIELAKSDKCIHSIKHKTKEIYGVLFHPEVRNKEVIHRFLRVKNIN